MAKYMLWTLNRSTALIAFRETKLRKLLEKANHTLVFGDRNSYNLDVNSKQILRGANNSFNLKNIMYRIDKDSISKDCIQSLRHRLMFEGEEREEYFVPIPLKCIGDIRKIKQADLTEYGRQFINEAKDRDKYYPYWSSDKLFEEYWSNPGDSSVFLSYPNMRMNTKNHMGYYEILRTETKRYRCKHILIGYSQGGLVARYLATLDEFVFKGDPIIDSVITIGSPNYGSPLANPRNQDTVALGLERLLMGLLGIYKENFTHYYELNDPIFSIPLIIQRLDAMVKDLESQWHYHLGQRFRENLERRTDIFHSIRKWLTGLKGENTTAFFNLNIKDHNIKYSPLNMVNTNIFNTIKFAAIVNGNSDVENILKDSLNGFWELIIRLLTKKKSLRSIGNVIKNTMMYEDCPDLDHENALKVKNLYNSIITKNDIPRLNGIIFAKAHDFIIPSSYETLPNSPTLVTTIVNKKSNHMSGGSTNFSGGRKTVDYIFDIFKKIYLHHY